MFDDAEKYFGIVADGMGGIFVFSFVLTISPPISAFSRIAKHRILSAGW